MITQIFIYICIYYIYNLFIKKKDICRFNRTIFIVGSNLCVYKLINIYIFICIYIVDGVHSLQLKL